jgi:cytochrome c6
MLLFSGQGKTEMYRKNAFRVVVVSKLGKRIQIRTEMEPKVKTSRMQLFAMVTLIFLVFIVSLSAHAQNASEALYKSKCAVCHGADGSGSATGKKMGAHDFTTGEGQGLSDAELATVITSGKNKMPAYGKSLKADDIKGLVAYIRTLKK